MSTSSPTTRPSPAEAAVAERPGAGRPLEDVAALLQASHARGPGGLALLAPLGLVMLAAAVLLLALGGGRSPLILPVALGLLLGSMTITVSLGVAAAGARRERDRIREVAELVELRRWPAAAAMLDGLLAQPMRSPVSRRMAVVQLVRVLVRYGRFDDAIDAADAMLEDEATDPVTRYATGVARAMALLRSERLYDASAAITQLRRQVNRARDAATKAQQLREDRDAADEAEDEAQDAVADARGADPATLAMLEGPATDPARVESAALLLVELYRDLYTGHPREVLEAVELRRGLLREQLGMRLGDALALAAAAADRVGEAERAARLYADATCLIPAVELERRYPETRALATRYAPTPRPA